MTQVFITAQGAGSFPDPGNWNATNTVECLGAGGYGSPGNGSRGGSGGGGGAYAIGSNINFTFPVAFYVSPPSTATGQNPPCTNWGTSASTAQSSGVSAESGGAAATVTSAGGGGSHKFPASGAFNGGSGGTSQTTGGYGAGGGGAAGPHGAGMTGSSSTGGGGRGGGGDAGNTLASTTGGAAGTAGAQWGAAGSGSGGTGGQAAGQNGGVGGAYGGGGAGGQATAAANNNGAQGVIVLTYAATTAPLSGDLAPSVSFTNPVSMSFIRAIAGDLAPPAALSGSLSFIRAIAGNLSVTPDFEGTFAAVNYVNFSGSLAITPAFAGALAPIKYFTGDISPSVAFAAGGSILASPDNLAGGLAPSVQLLGALKPGAIAAKNVSGGLTPSVALGPATLQVSQSILVLLPSQGGPPPVITTPTDGAVGLQFQLAYQRTFANIGVLVGSGTLGPVTVALRSYQSGGYISAPVEIVRIRIDLTGATAGAWVWAQIPPVTLKPSIGTGLIYILWAQTVASAGYKWYAENVCSVVGGTISGVNSWHAAYGASFTQNQPSSLGAGSTQAYGLNMATLPPVWNLAGNLTPSVTLAAQLVRAGVLQGDLAPQTQLLGGLSRQGVLAGDLPVNVSLAGDMIAGPLWEPAPPCPAAPWEEMETCLG